MDSFHHTIGVLLEALHEAHDVVSPPMFLWSSSSFIPWTMSAVKVPYLESTTSILDKREIWGGSP
eukprot:2667590-Ditylum_brightwellii.AAC.1